jgi:hypothetical protein
LTSATVEARICELDHNGRMKQVISVSPYVPEGEVLRFSGRLTGGAPELWVGPMTFFSMQHSGQFPFESHYTIGKLELEKERRRRAKLADPIRFDNGRKD